MKIAFLTPCVSRMAGGIFEIERRLAQSLYSMPDTEVEVFGAADAFTDDDAPQWKPVPLHTFPYRGPAGLRWSSSLTHAFCRSTADVAHLHALWMHTSLVVRRWSRLRKRPYLTTLNGMLEPWALANSTWKKAVTGALYERDCLRRAACLQVNSEAEVRSARAFRLTNPVAIIPNGVDVPGNGASPPPWAGHLEPGRKVLLYLGRLHPKKGLANFLRAWASVNPMEWTFAVAGWEQGGHEAELKALCKELGLAFSDFRDAVTPGVSRSFPRGSILFLGPQYGSAKIGALKHCDAFVLPSYSEGLPMVVLEAWANARPVLMTPGCNLPEGFAAGAAIEANPVPESLAEGLRRLLSDTDSARSEMGARGLDLVRDRFTWEQVAGQIRAVYAWLVGGGDPPPCVVRG